MKILNQNFFILGIVFLVAMAVLGYMIVKDNSTGEITLPVNIIAKTPKNGIYIEFPKFLTTHIWR